MKDQILKKIGKRGKTKSHLAYDLDLSFSTVSTYVNELEHEGKVKAAGTKQESYYGRPSTLYVKR